MKREDPDPPRGAAWWRSFLIALIAPPVLTALLVRLVVRPPDETVIFALYPYLLIAPPIFVLVLRHLGPDPAVLAGAGFLVTMLSPAAVIPGLAVAGLDVVPIVVQTFWVVALVFYWAWGLVFGRLFRWMRRHQAPG